MLISKITVLVAAAIAFAPRATEAAAACPAEHSTATVVYANGVRTFSADDARREARALHDKVVNSLGDAIFPSECLSYDYAYSTGNNAFIDIFLESPALLIDGAIERFWRGLAHLDVLPDSFQQAATASYNSVSLEGYISDTDVGKHLTKYGSLLADPLSHVIVVAHSQGNLYANQERRILLSQGLSPERFRIVAVATPDSLVEGHGPWTTLFEDLIASDLFRAANLLVLPPNTTNDSAPCFMGIPTFWDCHDFKNYLDGNRSGPQIVGDVIGVLSQLTSPSALLAVDDSDYRIAQGGTLTVPAPGVLDNDNIPNGFTSVLYLNKPQGFTDLGGGGFSYSPPAGTAGVIQFAYSIHTSTVDSVAATITITVTPAPPTWGGLDSLFGIDGTAMTDLGGDESVFAAAASGDGGLIVAGSRWTALGSSALVTKFDSAGRLDAGFGTGGVVLGPQYANAYAVTVHSDGRIFIAGQGGLGPEPGWVVARYTAAGKLDPSFGDGGIVTTDLAAQSASDQALAIVALPDGGAIVAGTTGRDLAVVRYTQTGAFDLSFGVNGVVILDVGGWELANAIAVDASGNILIAASAFSGSSWHLILARVTHAGTLDPGFGEGGIVVANLDVVAEGTAMAIMPDGSILVTVGTGAGDFLVARFLDTGELDATFGASGLAIIDFGFSDQPWALAIQTDGYILVAGEARLGSTGSASAFALARLTPQGILDTTFGDDGKVINDFGMGFMPGMIAHAVVVQTEHRRAVVVGTVGSFDIGLAGYMLGPP